jgi:hypothetical protein
LQRKLFSLFSYNIFVNTYLRFKHIRIKKRSKLERGLSKQNRSVVKTLPEDVIKNEYVEWALSEKCFNKLDLKKIENSSK